MTTDDIEDFRRAQEAIRRRQRAGLSFTTVRRAFCWFFPARERMQSAHNMHPRGELNRDGEMVYVRVDGGGGGDLDEMLSTLSTLGSALRDLEETFPRQHAILLMAHRDGQSTSDIGRKVGLSPSTISANLGRAEAYLAGRLKGSGVLR